MKLRRKTKQFKYQYTFSPPSPHLGKSFGIVLHLFASNKMNSNVICNEHHKNVNAQRQTTQIIIIILLRIVSRTFDLHRAFSLRFVIFPHFSYPYIDNRSASDISGMSFGVFDDSRPTIFFRRISSMPLILFIIRLTLVSNDCENSIPKLDNSKKNANFASSFVRLPPQWNPVDRKNRIGHIDLLLD